MRHAMNTPVPASMWKQALDSVTDPATGKVYPIPAGGADDPPADDPPADPPADDPPADDPPAKPEDDLGDKGKKALAEERAARKEAERKAKRADELEAELEKFREDAMSEQEKAIEKARKEAAKEARDEVLSEVHQKIAAAEARALAAGKTRDPEVAVTLLGDLTEFVTDDGDVDADAMSAALDKLVEEKDYLAVGDRQPVPGADQGARGGNGVTQLTRDQLETMTPEQIVKAKDEGRLDVLMGR